MFIYSFYWLVCVGWFINSQTTAQHIVPLVCCAVYLAIYIAVFRLDQVNVGQFIVAGVDMISRDQQKVAATNADDKLA